MSSPRDGANDVNYYELITLLSSAGLVLSAFISQKEGKKLVKLFFALDVPKQTRVIQQKFAMASLEEMKS